MFTFLFFVAVIIVILLIRYGIDQGILVYSLWGIDMPSHHGTVIALRIFVAIIMILILFVRYGGMLSFLAYSWWGVEIPPHQRILDPTARSKDGYPIIFSAIENNDKEWVEQLIAKGVDINTNEGFGRETPAIVAAMALQWEICYILLEHGANPDVHDESGISIANLTNNPRLLPNQYRQKVIDYLKSHNVAVPGPTPAEWRARDAVSQGVK